MVSNDWFTLLIILSILLIAIAKSLFASRFTDFLALVGNSKYLKIHSRDQRFLDLFDGLLFLNLTFSVALFVLLVFRHQSIGPEIDLDFFFKLAIGIGAAFLIKILVERLVGSMFEIDSFIDAYLFQKISYRNFIGILLVPINVFFLYSINPSKTLVGIVIIFLLMVNIIGIVTTIKNHQKLLINNFFYFILYLCALEISPYIILYKVIMG